MAKILMELLKNPSSKRYYYAVFLEKSWYNFQTIGEIKFWTSFNCEQLIQATFLCVGW